MRSVDYLLIGGGMASAYCASELRSKGADGSILLVGREPDPPYERPPLSKDYLRGESPREKARVHPERFYADHDIALWTGALWAEGPAWNGVGRFLLWSDIPNDIQLRWLEENGQVSTFRNPSGNSNGNTFDWQGRQISMQHGERRVVRYEHDGTTTVLAATFDGKPFNSPNDAVVHPNGSIWFTDPPYGVNYDPEWRNEAGVSATMRTGKVANDDRADWRQAWALFPGDVAYVWHAGNMAHTVAESLVANGLNIRAQIIWAKERLVMGRGDYHWQHEPCWYAVRKNAAGKWAGDRKQTTLWHIQNHNPMGGVKRDGAEAVTGHGTQKPVECMKRPIENNSSPGQAVYEPFSGSGTTIIAGEMTGRSIHAIELSPAYVDVAIIRWQEFTGEQAVHEDGRLFDELRTNLAKAA